MIKVFFMHLKYKISFIDTEKIFSFNFILNPKYLLWILLHSGM